VNQDEGIFQDTFHPVGVGDEIGGEIAAVELHPLDDIQDCIHALGFFNRDNAVLADFFHGFGNDLADGLVVVGRDGADLDDHLAADFAAQLLELFDDLIDSLVDAFFNEHGVGAGRDIPQPFRIDGLGQHGGGGRPVAGHIRRLGRDFLDQLGAHVLEIVFELNLFGHGHTVFGARRGAEFFVDHDILSPGAEGGLDQVR
jgi:hypothetical protein